MPVPSDGFSFHLLLERDLELPQQGKRDAENGGVSDDVENNSDEEVLHPKRALETGIGNNPVVTS